MIAEGAAGVVAPSTYVQWALFNGRCLTGVSGP
jgi:hypothetical protein